MEAIVPYLYFNGKAAEALTFYSTALDGEILFQQTYGDSPMEVSPDSKGKIMHATFKAGELSIMVSDSTEKTAVKAGTNISLSLNFKDEESMTKVFNALSDGGNIAMPLQDTFWGARFGMATDKFGIHWMFNHDKTPQGK